MSSRHMPEAGADSRVAQLPLFAEGRRRRDEGMARVHVDPQWVADAERWVQRLAPGSLFTAETLTAAIGRPSHPNAVGARLNALARSGLIAVDGFVQAERSERHASRMLRWRRV